VLINYSDPASYSKDWGGPSLAGVFAVHAGPGIAVVIASFVWLYRRRRTTRATRKTRTTGTDRNTGTDHNTSPDHTADTDREAHPVPIHRS
jgi:hypothetical protein